MPSNMEDKRLGRLIEFDERSRSFPVRTLIPDAKPRNYTWSCASTLNQGDQGSCVGFAFTHEAAARPVKVHDVTDDLARAVYRRAQQLDDYPDGEEGTSVLAGAKACIDRGWYSGYRWAFGLDDVVLAIGHKGPVVLGINWYEGMEDIDSTGFVRVAGEVLGGHAILANGVNINKRVVRLHNSWGRDWGNEGECLITFDDLSRLLHEQGEACVPLGRQLGPKPKTETVKGKEQA